MKLNLEIEDFDKLVNGILEASIPNVGDEIETDDLVKLVSFNVASQVMTKGNPLNDAIKYRVEDVLTLNDNFVNDYN